MPHKTQHWLRCTATLPSSPSAWSQPPQSTHHQWRLQIPTLVQLEELDNCKVIHSSPLKSESVWHGHLPAMLGQLDRTYSPVQKHNARIVQHNTRLTVSLHTNNISCTCRNLQRNWSDPMLHVLDHKFWYNKHICNLIIRQPERQC